MSYEMPNYDEEAVQPMRDELVRVGFTELRKPDQVDEFFQGAAGRTDVVVINSVCGCAAGGARPGVSLALQNAKIPDRMATVFAGQDKGAVAKVREHLKEFPPSSPFIAVLKDGKPVHVMQRHDIEGKDPQRIARELSAVFDAHCARSGPSIPAEEFAKISPVQACGSTIPPHTVKIEMPGARPGAGAGTAQEEQDKKGWWKLFK